MVDSGKCYIWNAEYLLHSQIDFLSADYFSLSPTVQIWGAMRVAKTGNNSQINPFSIFSFCRIQTRRENDISTVQISSFAFYIAVINEYH